MHQPVASHWQTLSHNVVLSTHRQWADFELTTLVGIDIDCRGAIVKWKIIYGKY